MALADRAVGWNQSVHGPAGLSGSLGIDGSGHGSSLPLTVLLSPCLHLRDVTIAHDTKLNRVPWMNAGMTVNSWPSGVEQVKESLQH